ncbi:MAG TPA: hypothetical protein VLL48_11055, partial [Longimicrobiales bacterium]|nr:hypothetical protein [Longimicrobiales bacterium]
RIVQEPASRASGSSLAACPVADGTLPPGSCTMTLTARASNASSGTGTLVPALATFELALVRQTGEGDVILETRATAVNILDPLPRITDVELVQPWIALAGPGTDYIVTIDNPGPGRSSIRIQGWLVQGAEEGSVGDRHVNCGASGGVLPTGTCVTTGSFETVSGGGTGGMTQGPATLEVRLVESGGAGGTLLDTWSLSVMLVADAVGIVHVELDAPTIPLEGATGYTVTLYNPGPPVSGMLVQGEVEQGAARRAAGGTILGCPTFDGVLPTGLCTLRWDALASNSTGGTGTLVPGDAIFLLSLHEAFGVVDTRAVPVTLTGSAP